MESRTFIIRKTLVLLAGEILCSAAACGVFALLDRFDRRVVLGVLFGTVLAVGNFFLLAVAADHAADQASGQDAKGGKTTVRLSYTFRLILLFVLLFALAKSGICNVLALVLPLAFLQPILMVTEFFRKEKPQ